MDICIASYDSHIWILAPGRGHITFLLSQFPMIVYIFSRLSLELFSRRTFVHNLTPWDDLSLLQMLIEMDG